MKKSIFLSLMTLFCIATQAQEQNQTKVRATGSSLMMPTPEPIKDKKTKANTIALRDTENNSWHEDIGVLDNVPVEKDIKNILSSSYIDNVPDSYTVMSWRLTDEGENTVLHCYLQMPADIVTNLWLCSDESAILDKETGIIYQAKGSIPERCYDKVFGVKSKKGNTIDLQILFPKLPDNARDLAIYGVPGWNMRGINVKSNNMQFFEQYEEGYDSIPQFHMAKLVRESVNYDKDNSDSWAEYKDPHLIKPVEEKTMAIWLTPETTYLAIATEQNWFREYLGMGGNNILLDSQGRQYKCKGVMGYPNDNLFWLNGYPGDYFAIVLMFEPLSPYVSDITYVVPEGKPFKAWGANWSGDIIPNLDISQLRENQKLFKYHQRVVVK